MICAGAVPSLAQRIYLFRERPPLANDNEILRYIIDLEESIAMVATSKSSALGATLISPNDRNLSDSAFGNFTRSESDHSGQFNRPIQAAVDFYSSLVLDIDE